MTIESVLSELLRVALVAALLYWLLRGVKTRPLTDALRASELQTLYFEEREQELYLEVLELRRLLFRCAPSFQGGHSDIGHELSQALEVPFPLRMPALTEAAVKVNLDTQKLWPWLYSVTPAPSAQGDRNNPAQGDVT